MLNWIIWNSTVFDIETVLTLNLFEKETLLINCVLMLNWIVWNRTDYLHKNGFGVK